MRGLRGAVTLQRAVVAANRDEPGDQGPGHIIRGDFKAASADCPSQRKSVIRRFCNTAKTGYGGARFRPETRGDIPSPMTPLSGLDAAFLYLETPETPMHV